MSDPEAVPQSLAAALAGRYTLERELGRGGMATVYLAHDLRHDRSVALKILHPDLAQVLGPARFQREIRLAARLQHAHILPVHDSGEAAGVLWFTMPYVAGETLRERLRRERRLPVAEAVRIAREAAQALEYAHRHGVVHRDVKPENLLLEEDGATLVADFGIARALHEDEAGAGPAADTHLTLTGHSIGTPAYMSPEQAAGAAVDARTDVYALAVTLHEMLTGELPYPAGVLAALAHGGSARGTDLVPHPRAKRPETSPALDAVVHRGLAVDPAARWSSAAEFGRALDAALADARGPRRRVPVAALVLLLGFLLGVGALFAWRAAHREGAVDTAAAPGASDARRLAVLPFDNIGDSSDAYFADGVTDEVRGKLASLPGVEVIARASSNSYRRTAKSPAQIARELGVRYLLTGTVRWEKRPGAGSRVRVSPELIDAAHGTTRWQQPFDAPLTDVFQVQADIAGKVAEALDVALGARQQQRLAERPTANLEAYDALLQGDEISHQATTREPVALHRAVIHYRRAVALDSGFALAWTRLARVHAILFNLGEGLPADSAASARAAARALALAPELPDTRLALGTYDYRVLFDFAGAREQFERGRRLAPSDADFYGQLSIVEQSLGRWDEAVVHAREGFRLDPRSSLAADHLARALLFARRYDEALPAARQATRLDPTSPDELWLEATAHVARGDLAGARAVYREAATRIPRATVATFMAEFWELAWTLEPDDRDRLTGLTPAAFGDDRAAWGLCLAQAWALKGDSARARVYADSARLAYERQIRADPRNDQARVLLGLSLAYLGRYDAAVVAARQGMALRPIERDRYGGVYDELQLARIYAMAGRRDSALAELERLLRIPSFFSPGWARIDPTFAALRGDPRFERLTGGT